MNSIEMLNSILEQQRAQLDLILAEQKKIRKDVTGRNWEDLEAHIITLNYLSQQFSVLEEKRTEAYAEAKNEAGGKDILLGNPLFHMVHQKLAASRIENDSLNSYINVTRSFLQSVFDNVVPQRRNVVYSNKGKVMHSQPESMLLNTLS